MSLRTRVTRRDKLAKKLMQLAPAAHKSTQENALKSAQEVVDLAKKYVPVKSGGLRRSGSARLVTLEKHRVVAVAGFSAPHAHLEEFGTSARFTKTGKSTGVGPRQPFLFPAYRLSRRRIKGRFIRGINKALKGVASK